MKKLVNVLLLILLTTSLSGCEQYDGTQPGKIDIYFLNYEMHRDGFRQNGDSVTLLEQVSSHAEMQTYQNTIYDGSYVGIGYPGGDVGYQQGVCTDVVIRAFRIIDIDLQELIHNDMKNDLETYNKRYKTKAVDKNIDHRRTQNIQTYLTKIGAKIKVPNSIDQYKPGDILFWDIAAGHTGIVVSSRTNDGYNRLVVHNIGGGAVYENLLSCWTPVEVYRLNDSIIKKMKSNCKFKYDSEKDFKRYVQ